MRSLRRTRLKAPEGFLHSGFWKQSSESQTPRIDVRFWGVQKFISPDFLSESFSSPDIPFRRSCFVSDSFLFPFPVSWSVPFSLSAFLSRSFRCSCKKLAGMHRSLGRKYCSYQNGGNKFERYIFQTRFVAFAIGAMAILLRKTSPNSARKDAFAMRKPWS